MGLYYNCKKVRNLYYNGKCITRLALGKEMTRLVEGDDFVRAKWLCKYMSNTGTISTYSNKAVIDTGISFTETIRFEGSLVSDNVDNCSVGIFDIENNYGVCVATLARGTQILAISGINAIGAYSSANFIVSRTYVTLNGVTQTNNLVQLTNIPSIAIGAVKCTSPYGEDIYRYLNSNNQEKNYGNIKIGPIKIYDNTTENCTLTPCRLLRPIPATLDANGIARNAGECGMYDAVSGKFYGNVASSGSFTVSDN